MATRTDADAHLWFLRERFGPAARVTAMRPGEWSAVYAVLSRDADVVVRFSSYHEDFEKDAYAARYSSTALPIPPILDWGRAFDGFYAVAPRVSGEHIDGLDEHRMRSVLPSFFAALDALREVQPPGTSGFGGWRADGRTTYASWRGWLLGFIDEPVTRGAPGWREVLAASPTGTRPFEDGYARLRERVGACPEDRHLFHDDLINRNVLVDDDRLTAVLDWGSSKYGDFLYDIAKLVFYQPWFPAWHDIDFAAEARAHYDAVGLAVPSFAERMSCYMLRIGLEDMAYSAWRKRWDEVERKARRIGELADD